MHASDSVVTVFAFDDQFADHRVEIGTDFVTLADACVYAHVWVGWFAASVSGL